VACPLGLAVALLLVSCAGPTYTEEQMRSQASRSANSAVSDLETLRLVVRAQLDGNTWWQYTDVVVTDSEGSLSWIESTLSSRQPPNEQSAGARAVVVQALGDAVDLAQAVRIAVRDNDEDHLRQLLPRLRHLSSKLSTLSTRVS
jgi:hypothetical protein